MIFKTRGSPSTRFIRSGWLMVAAALLAAGCSPQPEIPAPTATSDTTTAAPTTTQAPTPEELAAEAAMTAFTGAVRVTDAASQAPGAKDWESDIRRYTGDPYAYLAVQSVRTFATRGIKQVGDSKVDAEVTEVNLTAPEGPTVAITACFDTSGSQLITVSTGEPIPPGTLPRYVWNVRVIQYPSESGSPWLVSTLDPLPDQPC